MTLSSPVATRFLPSQRRLRTLLVATAALAVLAPIPPLSARSQGDTSLSPPYALAAAPQGAAAAGLHAIERQVEALRPDLVRTTVAIYTRGGVGSGVLLTPDGLVLTAAHVIAGPDGRREMVVLDDGRRFRATFVGADRVSDLGLVQIVDAHNLPAAPLGDSSTVRRGAWVLATGHPLGRQEGRPPVLRIGRVLNLTTGGWRGRRGSRIATDAPIINGDSGGPLFDLDGHVVGINSMISDGGRDARGLMASIHTPVNLAKAAIDLARAGQETPEAWEGPSPAFVEALNEAKGALQDGDLITGLRRAREAATIDPASADARLLMARSLARDRRPGPAATALGDALGRGFSDTAAVRDDPDLSRLVARDAALAARLNRLDALNGLPGQRKGDAPLLAAAAPPGMDRGVVRVRAGGKVVALGTVLSAAGDIVTKASELPDGVALECILPNGRIVPARRRGADAEWDVALLTVRAPGLRPVALIDGATPAGAWTISPDGAGAPAALGVVSVPEMPVRGQGFGAKPTSKAFLGVRLDPVDPDALRSMGLAKGVAVEVDPDLPAARAGIRDGDVLFAVDGHDVGDPDAVMDLLVGKQPGDSVAVQLARGDERLRVTVKLATRPAGLPGRGGIPEMLSGAVSRRSGPFPRVLDHDAMLRPEAMGGPVLDSSGRCLGINIARADRACTYAIRADDLEGIYARLKGTPTP
jgi:S1-C subfamily serine protease